MWVAVVNCARGQLESVVPETELFLKSGRIFVSTNSHHAPFPILDKDLDLASKLGKKAGTNDLQGVPHTTEGEHPMGKVNGKFIIWHYYVQSGRYAYMHGNRLTLVDFELVKSHNEETLDQLVLVNCHSKSFIVNSQFLEKLEKLKESSHLKKR